MEKIFAKILYIGTVNSGRRLNGDDEGGKGTAACLKKSRILSYL
jgi:hypothetical protein